MDTLPSVDPLAWKPHGDAMLAYHRGHADAVIGVHDDFGDYEEHPVSYFFRTPEGFPDLERLALAACRGRVLDVGAGTGCHALALQEQNVDVTAIETLPVLVQIMTERGVRDARLGALGHESGSTFDTVLMLMNGLGLALSLAGLAPMLDHLATLMNPGGQVVADGTDPRVVYRDFADGQTDLRPDGRYLGDVVFQLEFAGERGPPFPQLYVDPDRLEAAARRTGWTVAILGRTEPARYLARLVRA